ncbi:hypothetical protein [Staphylococcus phage 4086-1]
MKIKKKFKLLDLLCYIDDNREKFKDKKIQFISDSGFNFVVIDSNNDISINFCESNNYGTTINNDLFTVDIDIDVKTHCFDLLQVYYISNNTKINYYELKNSSIENVLIYFSFDYVSRIINDNKVIFENGNVIEHE